MHHQGPPPPTNYGNYHIAGPATPISAPRIAPADPMEVDFHGPPPGGDGPADNPAKRGMLSSAYGEPGAKRARADDPGDDPDPDPNPDPPLDPNQPPPPPPPPQVDFVGVMDVGQGNCNLLVKNEQPVAYFDVGFPPPGMGSSAPPSVDSSAQNPPAQSGPIYQNATNSLHVVLSHWDWDHYQLGVQWPQLRQLPWLVPAQAKGFAATAFLAQLGNNASVYENNFPAAYPFPENTLEFTVYRCRPNGLPRSAIMNNSGLAISTEIRLPANGNANRVLMMPADASFHAMPPQIAAARANIAGLVAVHHGSRANRAADDLPNPVVGPGQGRIVYSYGIKPNGKHTHGFPTEEAMHKNRAAGWALERSTAQGDAITIGAHLTPYPLLKRGNIRIGAGQLAAEHANTAFGAFVDALE